MSIKYGSKVAKEWRKQYCMREEWDIFEDWEMQPEQIHLILRELTSKEAIDALLGNSCWTNKFPAKEKNTTKRQLATLLGVLAKGTSIPSSLKGGGPLKVLDWGECKRVPDNEVRVFVEEKPVDFELDDGEVVLKERPKKKDRISVTYKLSNKPAKGNKK